MLLNVHPSWVNDIRDNDLPLVLTLSEGQVKVVGAGVPMPFSELVDHLEKVERMQFDEFKEI